MAKTIPVAVISEKVEDRNNLQGIVMSTVPYPAVHEFSSMHDFLGKSRSGYQLAIVDDHMLAHKSEDIYHISQRCEKGPRIVLMANGSKIADYAGALNSGLIKGCVNMCASEQKRVGQLIEQYREEGFFYWPLSIGVLGATNEGTYPIVANMVKSGREVYWLSHRLSKGDDEDEGIGYREFAQLKEIPLGKNVTCFSQSEKAVKKDKTGRVILGGIEDLVRANPDIIICASALRGEETPVADRAEMSHLRDMDRKGSYRVLELAYAMKKHNSRARLGIITNPPESQALRAIKAGIDRHNVFTLSADNLRLRALLGEKINDEDEVFVVGSHDSPMIRPELFGQRVQEKLFDSVDDREKYIKDLEGDLRKWGVTQRKIALGYGISSTDVGSAASQAIEKMSRFLPASVGYYTHSFEVPMQGPSPIDDGKIGFMPQVQSEAWIKLTDAEGTIRDELERVARKIKRLASEKYS